MQDFNKLLSGSDIRGNASEYNGKPIDLDDETVFAVGKAFVYWLSAKLSKEKLTIAVGHDSRISAERIKERIIIALKESGCLVLDCGLCSTPSMFMMTQYPSVKAHGAIMITASHHPFYKNGLKFFDADGGLESQDVARILSFADSHRTIKSRAGKVQKEDYVKLYCDTLIEKFRHSTNEIYPLKGLKIVVDAGNGAGGFFVDRVLKPLGADCTGSQFLEPNGLFPNHIPNPENEQAMNSISQCVKKNKADLGIIFDTDVDRAACVAPDGQEINRNKLIALISAILLEEQPGATIVTDSVTSDGLTEFISSLMGSHHRFKRGYKNVINEAKDLNVVGVYAPLAIETSGHAAFAENYFLDDGAYLMVRILIKMCQLKKDNIQLMSLINNLREPQETNEFRVGFKPECKDWKTASNRIMTKLTKKCSSKIGWTPVQSYEGMRINFTGGWFLVRLSVHDPILVINIESDKTGGIKHNIKRLFSIMKKFRELDVTVLRKFCKPQKIKKEEKNKDIDNRIVTDKKSKSKK